MRRKSTVLWDCIVIMALAFTATRAHATTIGFYSDGVIQAGDNYDIVEVYDTPPYQTTVEMTGGQVGEMGVVGSGIYAYDSSTVNIAGGYGFHLYTHDSSTANISGGWVGDIALGEAIIAAYDSSTINVYHGGTLYGGMFTFFELFDSTELNIHGGNVAPSLRAYNSANVSIYDGHLSSLHLLGRNTVNVYGGSVGAYMYDNALSSQARVNFYGHDFEWTAEGVWEYNDPAEGWWVSELTGLGFDGTPITYLGLPDPATHPNIVFIPEPGTFLLCVSGGLWILRKRKVNRYSK